MTIHTAASVIQQHLGYTFADATWLVKALTHATYANENPQDGPDYERLEFLGDAVIDLISARLLFEAFPNASEGELSRRRAQIVCRDSLARLALQLHLESLVRLGEGQRRQESISQRIMADTFEALAGAVYMDGGYQAAQTCFTPVLQAAIVADTYFEDFKTKLQEICHAKGFDAPNYVITTTTGPDHAREYHCEVQINAQKHGIGVASSKKQAEQQCAKLALQALSTATGEQI